MNWERIFDNYLSVSNSSDSTTTKKLMNNLVEKWAKIWAAMFQRQTCGPGAVVPACAPSTKEPEEESLKPLCSIYYILGHPGLHSKTQFHKTKRRKEKRYINDKQTYKK